MTPPSTAPCSTACAPVGLWRRCARLAARTAAGPHGAVHPVTNKPVLSPSEPLLARLKPVSGLSVASLEPVLSPISAILTCARLTGRHHARTPIISLLSKAGIQPVIAIDWQGDLNSFGGLSSIGAGLGAGMAGMAGLAGGGMAGGMGGGGGGSVGSTPAAGGLSLAQLQGLASGGGSGATKGILETTS